MRLGEALLAATGFDGITQIEFKRDPRDGSFRLIEINLRTWQWHSLARRCGVDLVGMCYRHATGEDVADARSGSRHDGLRLGARDPAPAVLAPQRRAARREPAPAARARRGADPRSPAT